MSYKIITDGYNVDKSYRVRIVDKNGQCIVDIPGINQQQLIQHVKELSAKYPINRRTDNIYSYDGRLIVSKTSSIALSK